MFVLGQKSPEILNPAKMQAFNYKSIWNLDLECQIRWQQISYEKSSAYIQ